MMDPYVQQTQASMYMSPWQGFTSSPNMMSGGPQGYMGTGSMSNMQNQFGGLQSSIGSSVYGAMYDNPFTTAFAMERTNILARPRGAHYAGFQAHADNISMGTGAAITSTTMEIGGGLGGSMAGAAMGSAFGPIGTIIGGLAGGMLGSSIGETAGSVYANRTGRQMETHRSLMGLSNPNSPYGGGFGYGIEDTKDIFRGMEQMAIDDPSMNMGDISRILDEGIKTGNIKGGSSSGDIKAKLKGLKETAKSLVEIFGDSDISEIMDTLRRLNGTGMTNSQAVETSRGIGMAARSLGMKEGDLFNQMSQDAEMKHAQGRESIASSLVMDPAKLLAFKYSKEAQDKFQGNDDYVKKLHVTEDKEAKLMSGKSGSLMLTKHGETSSHGLMVIAEAQAIEDAGGKENFNNLSRGEQEKRRTKALDTVYSERKNGNLMGLISKLSNSGSMEVSDYVALMMGDTASLEQKISPVSSDFAKNKNYVAETGKAFERIIDIASKDSMVGYLAGVSIQSTDIDVARTVGTAGGAKYQSAMQNDKNQTESAALRTAGSMDKRFAAMLTALSSAFGKFTEDIVSTAKDKLASGMQDSGFAGGTKNAELAVAVGSSVAAAEMHSKAGSRQSYKDMITTGDTGTSVFNGMSWVANQNDQLVNGVGKLAGLQKNSLGVNVQQEVVAMIKSQQYSSEKMLANAASTHEMFRVYESGDMSMDELKTRLSELGGKSTKDLAKFKQRIRDNGGSTVNKDIQGELSSIVDEGLGTVYGLSKMQSDSRNVSEFAEDTVDGIMSMFGIAHKPRDKQALRPEVKKQLSDMMTISVAGDKSMDAVQSALTGFEKVNFKALKSTIKEFGVSEGVDEYLTISGIADSIGSDGAFKLGQSLKGGEGDKEQTLKHLERKAQVGRSIKSAGIDVNSILSTIGFGVSGGMTVQQIDALGKELEYAGTQKRLHDHEEAGGGHGNRRKVVERRVKGITQSLMKYQGMSKDEAIEYQHAVGAQIRKNKESLAVFSQAPVEAISRMYQSSENTELGKFRKNLMGNGDALSAMSGMSDFTSSRKSDIFKAAKELQSITGGSDDMALVEKPLIEEWRNKNSDLSDDDLDKAVKLSRVKGIKKITEEEFNTASVQGAVAEKAIDASRYILGKGLQTRNEQASALGLLATFKQDDKGDFQAMSGLETKEIYNQAAEKQRNNKELTYREQLVVNSAKAVSTRLGIDADEVTGDQIRTQNKVALGISGMSDDVISSRMNGGKSNVVTDLLNRINENLAQLVNLAANPKGKAEANVLSPGEQDLVTKHRPNVFSTDINKDRDEGPKRIKLSDMSIGVNLTPEEVGTMTPAPEKPKDRNSKPSKTPPEATPDTSSYVRKVNPSSVPVASTDERTTVVNRPTGTEPAKPVTKEASTPAKAEGSKPIVPPTPDVSASSRPVTADMISLKGNVAKVTGLKRNEVLAKSDVKMIGLKEDTAEIMGAANKMFKAAHKQMVVTSVSDNTDGKGNSAQKHKKGSAHEKGKAFDVGYRSFKDDKEARTFGMKMQQGLAKKYKDGGVRVVAEKDHFHIALTDNKKDGGYFEAKDAYKSKVFNTSRSATDIKVMSVGQNTTAKQDYINQAYANVAPVSKERKAAFSKAAKEVADAIAAGDKSLDNEGKATSEYNPVVNDDGTTTIYRGKTKAGATSHQAKSNITKGKSKTNDLEGHAETKIDMAVRMKAKAALLKEMGGVKHDNEIVATNSDGTTIDLLNQKRTPNSIKVAGKNGVRELLSSMPSETADGTPRNYKIKGGEKAAQLNMATAETKKSKGESKRDLAAQTNTLLERIAAATESLRDSLSSAGPEIKKA